MTKSWLAAMAALLILLAGCSNYSTGQMSTDQTANTSANTAGQGDLLSDSKGGDAQPEDFNWTIYVNDSSTISMGQMNFDLAIDLKAVNTSGQIYGEYIGSATTKARSYMDTAKGSIDAPVEGQTTSLVINVNPSVSDDEKLAPLTPEDPDDGKLASLVPDESDDGKLAPLTDGDDEPDYQGSGMMVLQSGGTGTVTVKGVSVSRGIGNTSNNPLNVFIKGSTVRLEVQIPEIGSVYFDGYIRGEGK